MSIVRKFKPVIGNPIMIQLPDDFSAQEVEVTVIPYNKEDTQERKPDFSSVSQWDITEEAIGIKSWNLEEF